ncbi:hypothetical protein [Microbulbifer sp.]|uniref:hypothetical protein n=1 Tax=Microbulbifer sp. TaxID=1908541 RepID=UPI002F927EA1
MKWKLARTVIGVSASAVLISCGSIAADGPEQPALIVNPEPAAIAQLEQALVEANHGASVRVAKDVFSHSSRLALEQGRQVDGPTRPLTGRDLGKPRIFRLVKNSGGCWLVRAEDGQRWHLDKLTCVPE